MTQVLQNRGDLKNKLKGLNNRVGFLENSILFILLNPNLYKTFQIGLLQRLSSCREATEEEVYASILADPEIKKCLLGPEEIDDITLDIDTKSLKKKMLFYRLTRNLNK